MFFRDIIGYENLKKHLIALARSERIPHGILFEIADGMPGIHLAWAWAQYINCTNKQGNDSCGVCPSCKKSAALMHPDMHFSFPVANASQENNPCDGYLEEWRRFLFDSPPYVLHNQWTNYLEAGNSQPVIYVKEVESIIQKLSTSISESGHRIVIIYQIDKMNEAASNKLLKHLEEPPEKTIFINISWHPELLLDTIVSRLQTIEFPLLSKSEMENLLNLHFPNTIASTREQIMAVAAGNPGIALNLAEHNEETEQYKTTAVNIFSAILQRNTALMKQLSDDMASNGREWNIQVLTQMSTLVEQLLYSKLTETPMVTARNYTDPTILTTLFSLLTPQLAGRIYQLLESAIQDIKGNVLSKLVLFNTFTILTQHIANRSKEL